MSELLKEMGEKYSIKLPETETGFTQREIKRARHQTIKTIKEHIKQHHRKFHSEIESKQLRRAYKAVLSELQNTTENYRVLPIWMTPENQYTIRYLNPENPNFVLSPRMVSLGSDDSFFYLSPTDYLNYVWETKIPCYYLILQEIYSVTQVLQRRKKF